MPSKLPDNLRSLVIQQWLAGTQRDKIAGDSGLSAGAVTNIVNEWRLALGFTAADGLRELAVTLKKIGISAAQCAVGFRVAIMMNRLGVREDNFESFMYDIYKRCNNLGLTPESIASYLANLIEFSKTVPLSQISEYIQQKADEKKKLEDEIQKLKDQVKILKDEKSSSELRRTSALYEEKMTAVELKSYSDLKEQLGGYGISIDDDVSKFAKVVHGISQRRYDVGKVINEFSDLELMRTDYLSYQKSMPILKRKYDDLNQECSTLEQSVMSYNQKLSLYDELQAMGFCLRELKLLRNTINEIAEANKIPADQAQQKFYKDIEEHYDDKLGFELQLNKLRSEISTVNIYLNISRTALLAQPLVGPSLQRLFSKGIVEEDIIELANLLFEKSNSTAGDVDSGRTNIDKQSLVSGLQKHGGDIKSTIQELNQQADKLKNQVHELQGQKQGLVEQNQKMLSIIAYSDPVVKFLQGSDQSFSNDNDNVKILATIAFTLYILYLRYVAMERLPDDGDLNKLFVRLSRAFAAGGEESVSIREVKTAVAKVLDALIAKVNSNKLQANEDIALDVIRDCVSMGSELPANSKLEGVSS
jgi:cell division protein FtsB